MWLPTLIPLSLLLAVAAGLVRTWRSSIWLRALFIIQLVEWFALELPQLFHYFGKHDTLYALLWVVITVASFAAATGYTWEQAKGQRWVLFVACPVLPTVAIWVELYLAHPASMAQHISMGTGAVEAWLGMSILTVAAGRFAKILGSLWLAQAAYQIAFTLRVFVAFETWKILNNFIPPLLVIVAFSLIAWKHEPASKSLASAL